MTNYTAEYAFELQDEFVTEDKSKYGRGVMPLVIERDPETVEEFQEISRTIARRIEGVSKVVVENLYETPEDLNLLDQSARSYLTEPEMSIEEASQGTFYQSGTQTNDNK